jgi:hypothetical protein
MKVEFKMEKATKNTIKFNEVLENELSAPKIGTLYVQKATLGSMGWSEGATLVVDLKVKEQ